jgi:hypothetical protein
VGMWGQLDDELAHRFSSLSMVAGGESLEWTHRSIIRTSHARCSDTMREYEFRSTSATSGYACDGHFHSDRHAPLLLVQKYGQQPIKIMTVNDGGPQRCWGPSGSLFPTVSTYISPFPSLLADFCYQCINTVIQASIASIIMLS